MKPTNATPAPLTAEQLRIAQLFAAMDDRRQHEALVKLARMASMHPRRVAPALHLVTGGAA